MAVGTTTAALISAGGAVAGGLMSANAAGDAADAQTQASQAAIDEQRRQFDIIRELNEPFRQTDIQAMNAQKDLLGLGGGGGGGQVAPSGGPGSTNIPNRQSGTMPRQRDPGQFEIPGSGVQQGIPGISAPEPSIDDRFRNRRISNQEEQINNLAANPQNRREFLRQQIAAGNIDPNNEFIQNIFRRIGG